MEIRQFTWDLVDSNSWLITEGKHGLLIDAVDNEDLFAAIKQLSDLIVILSHSHFDHIIGLNKIRKLFSGCKVVATKACSEHIGNRHRNMSAAATAFMAFYSDNSSRVTINPFICDPADDVFENMIMFDWYGNKIGLFAVYGHTNDGLIVEINEKYVFSGDTLLHIPTVTRFPTGNKELFMKKDIALLKSIKAEVVYPGHGQPGYIKDLMKTTIKQT